MIGLLFGLVLQPSPPPATADASALDLADLEAYREALAEPAGPAEAPTPFRQLWDRADQLRGHRVTVEGRLVRRFQQGAVGQFPPLTEGWLSLPSGDLICLVYPVPTDSDALRLGSTVRFTGRYVKRLRYAGGDVDRVAPLIVGGGRPEILRAADGPPTGPFSPFGRLDWAFGGVAAGLVVIVLLRQLARRPISRSRHPLEMLPPPEFVEPGPPAYNPPEDGQSSNDARPGESSP